MEPGHLHRRAAGDRDPPEVLVPVLIAHQIEGRAVPRPHGPGVLGVGGQQPAILRAVHGLEPHLGLVDVRMAVAPPLLAGDAPGHQGQGPAVRGRRGLELIEIALGADLQRRAAGGANAEDVPLALDVVPRRGEVDPRSVRRPAVQDLARVGPGQPGDLSRGQGQDIDAVRPIAGGLEGEPRPVGRVQGPRLRGGMGHQQMGHSPRRRDGPDVAARDEGDLLAVGRHRRLGQGRTRLCRREAGAGQNAGQNQERDGRRRCNRPTRHPSPPPATQR